MTLNLTLNDPQDPALTYPQDDVALLIQYLCRSFNMSLFWTAPKFFGKNGRSEIGVQKCDRNAIEMCSDEFSLKHALEQEMSCLAQLLSVILDKNKGIYEKKDNALVFSTPPTASSWAGPTCP